ncbi:MAG: DUF3619 family protein [Betaproteobacteria bacterium]
MNEKDFGQKIARTLNWGLSQLEEDKLARLRAARRQAMDAYREPVNILGVVTVSGQTLNVTHWIRKPLFWLPMLAVAIAIIAYTFNSTDDIYDDVGELDAKLLTGELPIDAFLDKDFASWVKESS